MMLSKPYVEMIDEPNISAITLLVAISHLFAVKTIAIERDQLLCNDF